MAFADGFAPFCRTHQKSKGQQSNCNRRQRQQHRCAPAKLELCRRQVGHAHGAILQRSIDRHNMRMRLPPALQWDDYSGVGHDSASKLCMSCGLCCQGLLHSYGVLQQKEATQAAELGFDRVEGEIDAFALPCAKFAGCCTIYESRPHACRGFRCALLRKLDDGQIAYSEALETVREARRLAQEALPDASSSVLAERFRAHLRSNAGEATDPAMSAGERLKFIALAIYLDRHFVLPRDGQFYSIQPIMDSAHE